MNLYRTLKKSFRQAVFLLVDLPANVRLLRYRDYTLLIALQRSSLNSKIKMSRVRRWMLHMPATYLIELRTDVFRWKKGWPVRYFLTTVNKWPYLLYRTFVLPFKRLALYV